MTAIVAIFIGGGTGSLARYGLSRWLGTSEAGFPLGTLAANFLACVVLGFLGGLLLQKVQMSEGLRQGIGVGFCGGFSTFSTFSNESLNLFGGAKPLIGMAYIAASLVFCLLGIWLGQALGKQVG